MEITIHHQPEIFERLEAEWNELLSRASTNEFFLTPQFYKSWWQSFGEGELWLMEVRDAAKKLVGVVPLAKSKNEVRGLGNTEVSDYYDWIVDETKFEKVMKAVCQFLATEKWQKLSLISLPERSLTRHFLQNWATTQQWQLTETQQNVCPVISLPKTWDEYLTQIGKKQRHEIKRKRKNVEEVATFVTLTETNEIMAALPDFIKLHQLSSAAKAAFWTPEQTRFFESIGGAAAQQNWLKLFFLEVSGERAATMLCFDYGNHYDLYNSGFNPQKFGNLSVGNVLTGFTIQSAIEAGKTYYNFLRGEEEYKFRYRAVAEPIFDLTISRQN